MEGGVRKKGEATTAQTYNFHKIFLWVVTVKGRKEGETQWPAARQALKRTLGLNLGGT